MKARRWLTQLLAAGILSAATLPEAQAQFNPKGRNQHPARPSSTPRKATPGRGPNKPARPRATPAAPAGPQTPATADAAAEKGANSEALIARYTAIVLAQPGAQFPLQRLAQLYRERDGNLDKLIQAFEQRANVAPGSTQDPSSFNALVALAGILQQNGQGDLAIATYQRAVAAQPQNPIALLAMAHVLQERGDKPQARSYLERSLPLLKDAAEIDQTLRSLLELALDSKDFAGAKEYHKKLVTRAQGSFFARAELGRELMLRGNYVEAEAEYRDVVKAASGDNRVLSPALRDLGAAQNKQGKRAEALKTLERALRAAGDQAGIRREILDLMVEVYRADERLPELVRLLEKEHPNDIERLRLLAGLYEEVGRVDAALETYAKALKRDPKAIEMRLRTVQLLQLQGDLDGAISQYRELTRSAPHNPEFVFQLAEALIQSGKRKDALAQLQQLEQRSAKEEEVLTALVDFYERVEEPALALKVLERLAGSGSHDPQHWIELGDRQFQSGDVKRARQTWQQILVIMPNRPAALSALGEVYLEHDLTNDALALLKQAVDLQPKNTRYRKTYAIALERIGASASSKNSQNEQYVQAATLWEQLLREAGRDELLAREARQHIVTLWSLSGQLRKRLAPLQRQFRAQPPDLAAGRLLAEALLRLGRFSEAETTLQAIVTAAPGDAQALQSLENVLVRERKLREAIQVLKKLVQAEPKRAREYYQRMARYSSELYEDDAALLYAARTVELSPDDAEGHRKLGEMYRQRQEVDKAVAAFRQAILKNDRLFLVYFQLAELLIGTGQIEEADQLLRRVFRASPDEELITRAVRLSVQLNLGRNSLASLEKELLPVALGNPQRPLYRRLLVEIYGTLAFPLMQQARSSDESVAIQARAELRRIGERAVKPLLDALSDVGGDRQQTALELLTYIENKGAGPALLSYATGSADAALRARAVIAVGALRDVSLLPRLKELLTPANQTGPSESDPVSIAAAWAVQNLGAPQAKPLLRQMLRSSVPSVRALAALGLGTLADRSAASELRQLAGTLEAGPLARAAAAFALGQFLDKSATPVLTQLTEASDPVLRETATLALARLRAPAAERAIADALMSPDASLAETGAASALVYSTGEYRQEGNQTVVPEGQIDIRELLRQKRPSGYTKEQHLGALSKLIPELTRVSIAAVQTSPERARAVANALLGKGADLGFRPLTGTFEALLVEPSELREWNQQVAKAVEPLASAVVDSFQALATHPLASVRVLALQFLAVRPEVSATNALLEALKDPDERVERAALEALSNHPRPGGKEAIIELLGGSDNWALRGRAAASLGNLSRDSADRAGVQALRHAAQADSYSLVREAALRALLEVDPAGSRAAIQAAAAGDPEPRVRETAAALLKQEPAAPQPR